MRISLNLATRPFTDIGPAIKRLRIAMAVLAVIAIGLGLGLRAFHKEAEEARARDHSLDAKIAAITLERKSYEDLMRQPANVQLMTQVATLNQLFDEKTFSWTLAMEDLEMVLPGGVQVSTLEPTRAKDGRITLHLRVVGARDKALELVVNLERSKHFLMPRIVGESAESTEGPGKHLEPVSPSNRIDLDLLADYNPAPPQESKHTEHRSAEKPEKTTAPATGSRGSNPARARHVAPPASGPLTGQSRPPLTGKPQSTPPKPSQPKSGPLQPMRMQPRGPMAPPNPTPGGPR